MCATAFWADSNSKQFSIQFCARQHQTRERDKKKKKMATKPTRAECIQIQMHRTAMTGKCHSASYQIGRLNMEFVNTTHQQQQKQPSTVQMAHIVYISPRRRIPVYGFDACLFTSLQLQFVKLFPFDANANMCSVLGTWKAHFSARAARNPSADTHNANAKLAGEANAIYWRQQHEHALRSANGK